MDFKELVHSPSAWALSFAIAALLGVWWARLTPITTNISLALAVLAVACAVYFQPWVQTQHWAIRIVWGLSAGCVAALLVYYTLWIDLSKAVLESGAVASTAKQPPHTIIAGATWEDIFTELTVMLANPTDWDFENVDTLITPDKPVIAAEVTASISGASLWREATPAIYSLNADFSDGTRRKIDLVPLASEFGFRLRVPMMPSKSFVSVRMAIAEMTPFPDGKNLSKDLGLQKDDYVMRMKSNDTGKSLWFGHPTRPSKVFQQTVPKLVEIKGVFEVLKDKKEVSINVPITTH